MNAGHTIPEGRLLSLDVFRGFAMVLLIAETTGLYDLMLHPALEGTLISKVGLQFQHSPWEGLRLWDMGLAFFMFISGAGMAYSLRKKRDRGETKGAILRHAAKRALWLFMIGWALYMVSPPEGAPPWAFLLDVLPALGLGTLVACLVANMSLLGKLGVSLGLIAMTEILYRLWPIPGFDQPFAAGHNFGSFLDLKLWGGLSAGHWVTFNIVPSSAFVVWGLMTADLLQSECQQRSKLLKLITVGLGAVGAGFALSALTPMIRKILTSSFMIASGGFSLVFLALSYWIIDVLKVRRWALVPLAVGMNPLFIFIFARSGGSDWFMNMVQPFAKALLGWGGGGLVHGGTALGALGLMCISCVALFKKEIFIKI
ncbi:MAG: heparan-alpha-glucosaminide N-acetyltransferase domain-containing protein [candidate division WOR-3 bacterium]